MDAIEALQRARSDDVAGACHRRGVILLTHFGSAGRGGTAPHDVDLGVLFDDDGPRDILGLMDDLTVLSGYDHLDLAVLNDAGPVIRERALVGAGVLHQARRSVHARAALAAMMEPMDTAWLRTLTLKALAQ